MWPSNLKVPHSARRITLWSLPCGPCLFHYVMLKFGPSRRKEVNIHWEEKADRFPPFTSPFQIKAVKKIVMGRKNLWACMWVFRDQSHVLYGCQLEKRAAFMLEYSVQWSTYCHDPVWTCPCGPCLEVSLVSQVALGTCCWKLVMSLVAFCMVSCWLEFLQSIFLEQMA